MKRFLQCSVVTLVFTALSIAAGHACGRERWGAKTLEGGMLRYPVIASTVLNLRNLPRPDGVDGFDAPRATEEERVYRVPAELLAFKLESDGDIHLVLAQSGDRSATMVAEIPDPRCMFGAPPSYVSQVAQARLAFVKHYGIPPVRTFRLAYAPIIVTGPIFFDRPHGQSGASGNDAEIHPVISLGGTVQANAAVTPTRRMKAAASNTCAGEDRVWVNTRSGVYHLPGSRWYGTTKQGMFMCRADADAQGYRAAENGN